MIPESMLPGSWKRHESEGEEYVNPDGHKLSIHRSDPDSGQGCRAILERPSDSDGVTLSKDLYEHIVPVAFWMMENSDEVFEIYEETGGVWMMSMWESEKAVSLWHKIG